MPHGGTQPAKSPGCAPLTLSVCHPPPALPARPAQTCCRCMRIEGKVGGWQVHGHDGMRLHDGIMRLHVGM